MWETDKAQIRAFRECYRNLLTEMREGGDVDLSGCCVQETNALDRATGKACAYYMDKNTSNQRDKVQGFYTPNLPYFQNL